MILIKRDFYLNQLIDRKENGMIKIITGIKGSGKSFLLFNLFKNYLLNNGVQEDNIIALSLDDVENEQYLDPIKLNEYLNLKIYKLPINFLTFFRFNS